MSSIGLKIPRLDLGGSAATRTDGSPQKRGDGSARSAGSSARSRLHAITERVLSQSTNEKTPRLSARGSRLSVRGNSTTLPDAPPTSRREGNTPGRGAQDATTPAAGSVMQRATFLDALISARRASGAASGNTPRATPRTGTAGPPVPPRLSIAHLASGAPTGSLTTRIGRGDALSAAARATPRGGAPSGPLTARGTGQRPGTSAGTPGSTVPAAMSVAQLADLAARRRNAAATTLELQTAAAAARSAAAARRSDLADMEVTNNALAAELAALRAASGEETSAAARARKSLLATMQAAADLLQLPQICDALAAVVVDEPTPAPTPTASGMSASGFYPGELGQAPDTARGRLLSPSALQRLSSLGSKLSAAEDLLHGPETGNKPNAQSVEGDLPLEQREEDVTSSLDASSTVAAAADVGEVRSSAEEHAPDSEPVAGNLLVAPEEARP